MISRNELSLAAVRLLSLYVLVQWARTLPATLTGAYWAWRSPEMADKLWLWTATELALLVPLSVGVALAYFSRRVARWVLPGADATQDSMPSASVVQSIAIGTFGLLLVAADFPDLVANVMSLSARNKNAGTSYTLLEDSRFLSSAISVGMGVALCAGAAFWSRLITALRAWGRRELNASASRPADSA